MLLTMNRGVKIQKDLILEVTLWSYSGYEDE